jgi:hypothetical protein
MNTVPVPPTTVTEPSQNGSSRQASVEDIPASRPRQLPNPDHISELDEDDDSESDGIEVISEPAKTSKTTARRPNNKKRSEKGKRNKSETPTETAEVELGEINSSVPYDLINLFNIRTPHERLECIYLCLL